MSTGAGGLTLVRAAEVRTAIEVTARARAALESSIVAWELASRARFDQVLATSHNALATLAFDVAEGVIGNAVTVDAMVLNSLVSQALTRSRRARRLLVCAHPDDVAAARSAVAEALSDGLAVEWIEVAGDSSMTRGCVAVETEDGRQIVDWAESLALARARWLASLPESRR